MAKKLAYLSDVDFEARGGEDFIRIAKADGEHLLEEANEPDWVVCPRPKGSAKRPFKAFGWTKMDRNGRKT